MEDYDERIFDKTEIEEFDTFAEFAADADLGSDDLVLCGGHTYQDYIAELNTGYRHYFVKNTARGNRPTEMSTQFSMPFETKNMIGSLQSAVAQ